jgi:hypothetical protein
VQANLDFADEATAASIDTGWPLGVTSTIVTALFASIADHRGKPNGWKSYRAAVWWTWTRTVRPAAVPFGKAWLSLRRTTPSGRGTWHCFRRARLRLHPSVASLSAASSSRWQGQRATGRDG